jgi:catechol 2,3-dioxygenase-like lactoylglutathione lyase family enzyme
MKVTGQHHIGITVTNLERSVAFYRDVLGMQFESQDELEGEFISKVVGVSGTHVKCAYLSANGLTLELFQYLAPTGGKQQANLRPIDVGNYHLAFLVDDMQEAYQELTSKGVKFADVPQYVSEGPEKGLGAIYFYDPDGITLELIQTPR